jgi:hypothetical protein
MTVVSRARPLAAALVVVLLAACGSKAKTSSSLPACQPLPEGIGPDAAGTVQLEQNGGTFCLRRGDVLTVFLKGSPDDEAAKWQPIRASDSNVLEPRSTGVMTLVRGVTGGIFAGGKQGWATLTSTRSSCPSGTLCTWKATVVVSGG